ncbi:MAG: YfiR family protein [Nitrospinales bacterium]
MFYSFIVKIFRVSSFFITFIFLISCFALPHSIAASPDSREYNLKAGYIYNFTKFIKWPEEASREINDRGLNFCLVGEDPFGEILDRFAKKLKKKNRDLVVIPQVTTEEMPQCHILFVSQSEESKVNKILLRVREYPVLVIGDTPGFAKKGVSINFFIQKNKIRFEINREALKKAGLVVSSELLNLARIVAGRNTK